MVSHAAISMQDVRKAFSGSPVLTGLDLEVPAGSVCAVLGPNGAGKTTAVRILTTLLRADSGRVEVAGVDVAADPRETRRRIGLVGQQAAVDEVLGARQNLVLFGRLHHLDRRTAGLRADELLAQMGIADTGSRAVRTFSGGMRRRLDLAAGLILRPQVLFLDEPTTGLDPAGRHEVWAAVRSLVNDGTTVLLTTQHLDEAEQLADTVCVLDDGKVVARGTPVQLTSAVGGDRLELVVADAARATEAALLAETAASGPGDDARSQQSARSGEPVRVTVPVGRRLGAVNAVVRALDDAGIEVDDLVLRTPTLEEAYLSITGHLQTTHDEQSESSNRTDTTEVLA